MSRKPNIVEPEKRSTSLRDLMANFGVDEPAQPAPSADTALAPQGTLRARIGGFVVTTTGIESADDATLDDWRTMVGIAQRLSDMRQWIIGDLANAAADHADAWGAKYDALIQELGVSYNTVTKWASVAARIPFYRRREALSYSVHEIAATAATPQETDAILDEAQQQGLSVRQVKALLGAPQRDASASPREVYKKRFRKFMKETERVAAELTRTERRQLAADLRALAEDLE